MADVRKIILFLVVMGNAVFGETHDGVMKDILARLEKLELENRALKERRLTLEERVAHLEELSKIKTLRTCHELAQYGVTTSGWYKLDPDGDLIGNQINNQVTLIDNVAS